MQLIDAMKIRILLADDHQMFRELLCHVLQGQADLEVVAQTGDGLQVIPLARVHAPHIVCMDIRMPGMNGIEVTRTLLQEWPLIKVVALSAYTDQRHVVDMLNAGACAYVTKVEASTELISAIRAVLRGRTYLCPDVTGAVAGELLDRNGRARAPVPLGKREREVLNLVARGHTSIQISKILCIAASTVEVHRRNIMRKLDLHGVAELTRYAINNEHYETNA